MDRLYPRAAFAAVLLSFGLAGCGESSSSAAAGTTSPGGGSSTTTITGVSTPSTVSVVTAKNAN